MTATLEPTDNALRTRAKLDSADAIDELVRRRRNGVIDPSTTPLWREPSAVRLRFADYFVGSVVEVDVDLHRDASNVVTHVGRLVSSAFGGTSGAVVLRFPLEDNRRDRLIELARVADIRWAPAANKLARFPV